MAHRPDDYDSQRNDEREQALESRLERDASREPFSARRVLTADDYSERAVLAAGMTGCYEDDERPDYDTLAEREMDVSQ